MNELEREVGEGVEFMDVTQIVPRLTTPALVVHDRNDKEIPLEEGLAVAAAWTGATMLVTERFGHRRIMLAGQVVQAVVEFLSSTPERSLIWWAYRLESGCGIDHSLRRT